MKVKILQDHYKDNLKAALSEKFHRRKKKLDKNKSIGKNRGKNCGITKRQ